MKKRKRRRRILLIVGVSIFTVLFILWRSAINKNRQVPVGPFSIAENLHYVGINNVTSFLITGPEGHVLIDGAYPETAPMIVKSIHSLGYRIEDVKVLLNSHAHFDHAGGLAYLKEASGAALWASHADAEIIEAGGVGDPSLGPLTYLNFIGTGTFPEAQVDHRFEDGATLRVGPIELTAHITAGHTPGCTSWSFPVKDGDQELLAVSICSLTILPFVSLVEPETYPGIRGDYEQSFATLKNLPADIFLGAHAPWFRLEQKMRKQADAARSVDPFIDPEGYLNFINNAEKRFHTMLAKQQGEE